jgi:hypothetical protein
VQSALPSLFRSLLGMLGLALIGVLGLPVAGYLVGKRVIGAYQGKLGLRDYLDSIYSAAASGEVLAWWLLLTPILVAIVWYLVVRVARRLIS